MAEDWAEDVQKYVPNADAKAIAGIVRYCGIALQKRDSSLVSFSDDKEIARVRNNFLKKKLALTDADADLDKAIDDVRDKMKGDRNKKSRHRVLPLGRLLWKTVGVRLVTCWKEQHHAAGLAVSGKHVSKHPSTFQGIQSFSKIRALQIRSVLMSIFGSIVSKIFGSGEAAAASPTAQSASSTAPSRETPK